MTQPVGRSRVFMMVGMVLVMGVAGSGHHDF